MKIWFDTEFIEDGETIELISIGMIREDGVKYYAENAVCDLSRASWWVNKNVLPHLLWGQWMKHPNDIAREIVEFAGPRPEFWAYFCSYDWVALCQLYGRMIDLPDGWPKHCLDVQQLRYLQPANDYDLPPNTGNLHNALDDAIWCKAAYEMCIAIENKHG